MYISKRDRDMIYVGASLGFSWAARMFREAARKARAKHGHWVYYLAHDMEYKSGKAGRIIADLESIEDINRGLRQLFKI